MNLLLCLFNLLPIPFFDGGQMLSLYIDPLIYKIGISESKLDLIKNQLNRLVGVILIVLALIPIINEIYLYLTKNPMSFQSITKWILLIIGAILIKRIIISIFQLNK